MTDDALLPGELSLWSAVLLGQGETDWANLLDKAANLTNAERPTARPLTASGFMPSSFLRKIRRRSKR
jgi:hypothetical protein